MCHEDSLPYTVAVLKPHWNLFLLCSIKKMYSFSRFENLTTLHNISQVWILLSHSKEYLSFKVYVCVKPVSKISEITVPPVNIEFVSMCFLYLNVFKYIQAYRWWWTPSSRLCCPSSTSPCWSSSWSPSTPLWAWSSSSARCTRLVITLAQVRSNL